MACDHALGVYSHSEDADLSTIRKRSIEGEDGIDGFNEYLDLWSAGVKWYKYCPECGEKLPEIT